MRGVANNHKGPPKMRTTYEIWSFRYIFVKMSCSLSDPVHFVWQSGIFLPRRARGGHDMGREMLDLGIQLSNCDAALFVRLRVFREVIEACVIRRSRMEMYCHPVSLYLPYSDLFIDL